MAYDLEALLKPQFTALVVFECQEGILGEQGHLPTLAAAAREIDLIGNIRRLLDAAHESGTRAFYCMIEQRPDDVPDARNTPLQLRLHESESEPSPDMGDIVSRIAPSAHDVVVSRQHGMTGFYADGLDDHLRACSVRTLVLTGVSVNIGIMGTAIEAVNRGYTVVVPTDCVAGDPPEYAQQALRYSIRNIAFLSKRAEIESIWRSASD